MQNTATIPNDERNEPIEGIDDLGKFSAIASGQRELTIEEQKILVRFHALSILRGVSFWLAGVAPKQYRNAKLGPFLIDKLRDQARQISDAISIIEDLAADENQNKGVNCADAQMPDMRENDQSETAAGRDRDVPMLVSASGGTRDKERDASDQSSESALSGGTRTDSGRDQ
jgi:hypothetical protein